MNGNMQKMMKQAQKLQRQMMEAQEALAEERVEATSGGGTVKVVADGQQNIVEIKIDPEAVDPRTLRCWRTWCWRRSRRRSGNLATWPRSAWGPLPRA